MQYNLALAPVSDNDVILKDETGADVNFRTLLIRICMADVDGDGQPVRGSDKMRRFELYMRLKESTAVIEFTPDDAAFLSKAALAFPTIVAGQVQYFLDQKPPFGAYVVPAA